VLYDVTIDRTLIFNDKWRVCSCNAVPCTFASVTFLTRFEHVALSTLVLSVVCFHDKGKNMSDIRHSLKRLPEFNIFRRGYYFLQMPVSRKLMQGMISVTIGSVSCRKQKPGSVSNACSSAYVFPIGRILSSPRKKYSYSNEAVAVAKRMRKISR
jgi:hypothetical protein